MFFALKIPKNYISQIYLEMNFIAQNSSKDKGFRREKKSLVNSDVSVCVHLL